MSRPRKRSPDRLAPEARQQRVSIMFDRFRSLRDELARWEIEKCDAGSLTGDIGPLWATFDEHGTARRHAVTRFEHGMYHAACGARSHEAQLVLVADVPACATCRRIDPQPTPWAPAWAVNGFLRVHELLLPRLACGFETAQDIEEWERGMNAWFWHLVEAWEAMPGILESGAEAVRQLEGVEA